MIDHAAEKGISVSTEVWTTKYALTKGIQKGVVERIDITGYLAYLEGNHFTYYQVKSEIFATEAEARADVLRRIERKRGAIASQLQRLERLERRMAK